MNNILRKAEEHKIFCCVFFVFLCVTARLTISMFSLGYRDFVQEVITARLASSGKNVYAEQQYYNYGPVFFILLGWLYKIASHFQNNVLALKFMLVSVLTLADFFTAKLIAKKAGWILGLVFFLNPISFITVSYLSQFDGLALAFAAYGIYYLEESAQSERFTVNDFAGIILLSLSLITKHIMWAFPLWILLCTKINSRKKFLYAFVPVLLFLMSFAPYWQEGREGIINNVFLYRSRSNMPILGIDIIYRLINHMPLFAMDNLNPYGAELFPKFRQVCFIVYIAAMLAGAYIFRLEKINNNFLLYTISAVCFASAISTQYLTIPCMALIILFRKKSLAYFPLIGTALLGKHTMKIVMVWALLLYLADYCRHKMSR